MDKTPASKADIGMIVNKWWAFVDQRQVMALLNHIFTFSKEKTSINPATNDQIEIVYQAFVNSRI